MLSSNGFDTNDNTAQAESKFTLFQSLDSLFCDFTLIELLFIQEVWKSADPIDFNIFLNKLAEKVYSGKLPFRSFRRLPEIIHFIKIMCQVDYLLKYQITSAWNAAQTEIQLSKGGRVEPKTIGGDDILPVLVEVVSIIMKTSAQSDASPNFAVFVEKIRKLRSLCEFIFNSIGSSELYSLTLMEAAITYCLGSNSESEEMQDPACKLTARKLLMFSSDDMIKTGENVGASLSDNLAAKEMFAVFENVYSPVPCGLEQLFNIFGLNPVLLVREMLLRATVAYFDAVQNSILESLQKDIQVLALYHDTSKNQTDISSQALEKMKSDIDDKSSGLHALAQQFPALQLNIKKACALASLLRRIIAHDQDAEFAVLSFARNLSECENILKQNPDPAYEQFNRTVAATDLPGKCLFEIAARFEYVPGMLLTVEDTDLKTVNAVRTASAPDGACPASKPIHLFISALDIIMQEYHRGRGISTLISFTGFILTRMDETDREKIRQVLKLNEVVDVHTLLRYLIISNIHDLELCEKLNAFAIENQLIPPFKLPILMKIMQRIEVYLERELAHLSESNPQIASERDAFRIKTNKDKQSFLTELYACVDRAMGGDSKLLEAAIQDINNLMLKAGNHEQYPNALLTYSKWSRSHLYQLAAEALEYLKNLIAHPEEYQAAASQHHAYLQKKCVSPALKRF